MAAAYAALTGLERATFFVSSCKVPRGVTLSTRAHVTTSKSCLRPFPPHPSKAQFNLLHGIHHSVHPSRGRSCCNTPPIPRRTPTDLRHPPPRRPRRGTR